MLDPTRFPEAVVIGECWARDGLQNEAKVVSTDDKVAMITGMVEAGITKIEATSFAPPKILPQFADADEVLARIPRKPGVDYRVMCTNMRAMDRAVAAKAEGRGADEIMMVLSASESHNRANVRMTRDDNRRLLEKMARRAVDEGHVVFGWVLTAFGCPIEGDVPVQRVLDDAQWWRDIGATILGFGDTTGVANPLQVSRFYDTVAAEGYGPDSRHKTGVDVVVHFHDTRGWGISNSLVALQHGYRFFDTSLGAIGGQPKTGAAEYHRGHTGNTSTEDFVGLLDELGVETGVDLERLMALGRQAEDVLGRRLRSNYVHAGPVRHEGIQYDPDQGILDA